MPYEEEDYAFFFGRSHESRLIVANLFAAPVTVLLGSSGVGKSSILRAGVVSALRQREDVFPVICSNWREDPLSELRREVRRETRDRVKPPPSAPEVSSASAFADEIRFQARQSGRHLMIILDQFEEFFLYHPSNEAFLDQFADAVNSSVLNPRAADLAASAVEADFAGDPRADAGRGGIAFVARENLARTLYRLDDVQRRVAIDLLRHLITPSGKRTVVSAGDLESITRADSEDVAAVIRGFERAGLLRSYERSALAYEISQDALVPALQHWLAQPDPVKGALADWLGSAGPASASYLISMRDDALAKLDAFEGRIPELMERLITIENLDRDGGREAIRGPLEIYNQTRAAGSEPVVIEPELVDAVLDQVAGGRIVVNEYTLGARAFEGVHDAGASIEAAFLQLVMTRLWEAEMRQDSSVLRLSTLTELQGAENIVRRHLGQVMERFSIEDQQIASRVFRYLITQSGSKIAHSATDLASYTGDPRPDVQRLLNELSAGSDRVLRPVPATADHPGDTRYEIYHDRLGQAIQGWLRRFTTVEVASPTSKVDVYEEAPQEDARNVEEGVGLCLSGGGYRGMLFHVGALWRLNELGILPKLHRVSSVSSGSFVAARLGLVWKDLQFNANGVGQRFHELIVDPLRTLAERSIDVRNIVMSLLFPTGAAERLESDLDSCLFAGATLADLPDLPRFVLVASNMQNGAVWRFSKPYVGDYHSGPIRDQRIKLSVAAASSAAVPPVMSPMPLRIESEGSNARMFFLTDGTVLDRLGIETVWRRYRTVLVSDGSGQLQTVDEPPTNWLSQTSRVVEMMDWQSRATQKRQLIDSFINGARAGAYWGIVSDVQNFQLTTALPHAFERSLQLARIPARFSKLENNVQEQLINWGYAVCDAAIRKHYLPGGVPPVGFPYPWSS